MDSASKIKTWWRNATFMSTRMCSKDMVKATLAGVMRGYKELLRTMHIVYAGQLLSILIFTGQLIRIRMMYWMAGYIPLCAVPVTVVVSHHAGMIYTLLQCIYVTLWALAVRASVGKKSLYYFFASYVRYLWMWGTVAVVYYAVIFLFLTGSTVQFIKDFMATSTTLLYVKLGLYAFTGSLLLWALMWFMWYALDDTAKGHVKRTYIGGSSFVLYNIVFGAFLVVTSWIFVACSYGATWAFLKGVATLIPAAMRARSVIFAVMFVSYTIIYPVLVSWLYTAYVVTRYSRPDRYLPFVGEE